LAGFGVTTEVERGQFAETISTNVWNACAG